MQPAAEAAAAPGPAPVASPDGGVPAGRNGAAPKPAPKKHRKPQ